jgi:cytochrome c oxidase subunit 3
MSEAEALKVQFDDMEQQKEAASLGIWIFLATEVLFFGALFMGYTVYRLTYPELFAKAGKELNITIGTLNTVILLTSSYFMALAVHSIQKTAEENQSRRCATYLWITWILGFSFLALKGYEYYDDIEKHLIPGATDSPEASLLYFIYYAMTGLHATHLTIGLGVVAVMAIRTMRGEFSSDYHTPVEVTGLYWHFVDIVWIFLYPLLYLMDRHS